MVQSIEVFGQVQIHSPGVSVLVVVQESGYSLVGTPVRSESETGFREFGSYKDMSTCEIACCTALSRAVGTPGPLSPPSGFEITTLRTGDGLYLPVLRLPYISSNALQRTMVARLQTFRPHLIRLRSLRPSGRLDRSSLYQEPCPSGRIRTTRPMYSAGRGPRSI